MYDYTEVSWDKNAPIIKIGPGSERQYLYLPDCTITAKVHYSQYMKGTFKFKYRDEKLILVSTTIDKLDGELETKELTELRIPTVKAVVVNNINRELIKSLMSLKNYSEVTDQDLAQLYWARHISDNEGRKTISSLMGWSRSNTNYHLNKLAAKGLLPRKRGW